MSRINLLVRNGVAPVVVFDGGPLPMKGGEERTRERSREENKARARQLMKQGNETAALECYQRSVDISPAMAKQFIEVSITTQD
jgi:exonuclease-1